MSYSLGPESEPATIEAEIKRTRASLDRKLEALERRFNPKVRLEEMKARFDPAPVAQVAIWGAVAALGVGTWMTINGLRRYRFGRADAIDDSQVADMMGE